MRFTLTLDDDVVAAVEHRCRKRQVGLSEVVNQLIRSGLAEPPATTPAPALAPKWDVLCCRTAPLPSSVGETYFSE